MLRFEIIEPSGPLPVIDLDDEVVIVGSSADARIRVPAAAPIQIRFDGHAWTLLVETTISGMVRAAGDSGPIGHGMVLALGDVRVRVGAAPAGSPPTAPGRIAAVMRELARSAPPSLELERGPGAGAVRALPRPEATFVIGCGDDASWVILDADLARAHCELHRTWDGTAVMDLGAKHGTRVDGVRVTELTPLHDGAVLGLGRVRLRFRDPALPPRAPVVRRVPWLAIGVAVLALLAWLLLR